MNFFSARTRLRTFGAIALVGLLAAPAATFAGGEDSGPSFVDPTAELTNPANISIGDLAFVAPFARLVAGPTAAGRITIGNESDVQDNVVIDATGGAITLGHQVILAHGAAVNGSARLGEDGYCPKGAHECPSFVGFNALVDGGILEKDAMVGHLARVGRGVRIPSGRKVLPGKNVATQAEVMAKTALVTEADREFMHGVIEVNVTFARQYTELGHEDTQNIRGINYDPGHSTFNHDRNLPTLAGQPVRDPAFRNRIIGDVQMGNTRATLDQVLGNRISLRADEGDDFRVGVITQMANETTFHALEHTHMQIADGAIFGLHSLVHGGPTPFADVTVAGRNLRLGASSVLFRSRVGDDSFIGARTLVQQSDLPAGSVIPSNWIVIENEVFGMVEW